MTPDGSAQPGSERARRAMLTDPPAARHLGTLETRALGVAFRIAEAVPMMAGRWRGRAMLVVMALAVALGAAACAHQTIPAAARSRTASSHPPWQTITQVWVVGTNSVWAWTQDTAGTGPQGIWRTTDAGAHWTAVTPAGFGQQTGKRTITQMFALNAHEAWLVHGPIAFGSAQILMATVDGGRHWASIGPLPARDGCTIQFVAAEEGFCIQEAAALGSEGVTIYATRDGGRRWTRVSRPAPLGTSSPGTLPDNCDKAVSFTNALQGWAAFTCAAGGPFLYRTENGGATWVAAMVAPPPFSLAPGSGFAATPKLTGRDGAVPFLIDGPTFHTVIYVTSDGGLSWRPVMPPGPPTLWFVDILTPFRWRLVAGRRILSTDNAGQSWSSIHTSVRFAFYRNAPPSPPTPFADYVTPQIGWIVSQTLWHTTDGGQTWKRIAVPGT